MTQAAEHITVLLHEAVEGLAIKPDGIYVDGTFGRVVTHLSFSSIWPQWPSDRHRPGSQAIAEAPRSRIPVSRSCTVPSPASPRYLTERGLLGKVDGFLLDLGVSSPSERDCRAWLQLHEGRPARR